MWHRRWQMLVLVLLVAVGLRVWAWQFPPRPQVSPLAVTQDEAAGPVLFIAPHSDDEALAGAGFLQQSEAKGASPRVVLVTGGDAFSWSAKAYYGWLKVGPEAMLAYGEHRVAESEKALQVLGLPPERLIFLGYPDQTIDDLWTRCWYRDRPCTGPLTLTDHVRYAKARTVGAPYAGEALLDDLVAVLREVRPSVVVYPHPSDVHVDHWGVSAFVTAALEQLRRTDSSWLPPAERLYLVHRGDWPAPKGYRPDDVLLPPETLTTEAATTWHVIPLTHAEVEKKSQAVAEYRTQTRIIGRFMESFVRSNEIYGTMERVLVPSLGPWAAICTDADSPGGLDGGTPPWSGLPWQMVMADPQGDTLAREIHRGGDVTRVWAANDGGHLYLAIRTTSQTRNPVLLRLNGRAFGSTRGWDTTFSAEIRSGGRVTLRQWPDGADRGGLASAAEANWIRLDLPLEPLGNPASVMINVESGMESGESSIDRLAIDRTQYRLLSLDGG